MIDEIVTKIKENIESISIPAYPFFFCRDMNDVNVVLEQTQWEKAGILIDWNSSNLELRGNGLHAKPKFTISFAKRVGLSTSSDDMRLDCEELETDILTFIRICEHDSSIQKIENIQVNKFIDRLDENLLLYELTFDFSLIEGDSLTECQVVVMPTSTNGTYGRYYHLTQEQFTNCTGGNFTALTINAGAIYSGGTNLYDIFSTVANSGGTSNIIQTHVQPGLNTYTGGTDENPTINISSATLSNLNVTGTSSFGSISATTITSGGTNLYDIFLTTADGNDITRIQPGLNTYTGGTANNPSINISAATLNSLIVTGDSTLNSAVITNLTASTITSGTTNLNNVFAQYQLTGITYPYIIWNM